MALQRFTSGPPGGVQKLNAIVDAVNDLNNLRGDDKFITLRKGPSGALISLNPQEVIRLVPKAVSSAGDTPFELLISDQPLILAPGLRGWFWFPDACTIAACAYKTDSNDTFGVTFGSAGSEALAGTGATLVVDTTLSGWTVAIAANTLMPITITGTPASATIILVALQVQS
jgi:hypothetical protein